jgi:hypothetical protein
MSSENSKVMQFFTFRRKEGEFREFESNAIFHRTTFEGDAYFNEAIFQKNAKFNETNSKGYMAFAKTTFQKGEFKDAIFQKVSSIGAVIERSLHFAPKQVNELDFRNTEFLFRAHITADLTQARFHHAHLQNVAFIDCEWPKEKVHFGSRICIYEEKHMNDENVDLSFKGLETIYRNLKQNMQDHGDYSTAGEFYYREMEMKRKGATIKNRIWLTLYRIIAGYGEKPQIIIRNSFFVIFIAAILFFFCGVARVGAEIPPDETPYIINYFLDSLQKHLLELFSWHYLW